MVHKPDICLVSDKALQKTLTTDTLYYIVLYSNYRYIEIDKTR